MSDHSQRGSDGIGPRKRWLGRKRGQETLRVERLDSQAWGDMTDVETGSCSSGPSPGGGCQHRRCQALRAEAGWGAACMTSGMSSARVPWKAHTLSSQTSCSHLIFLGELSPPGCCP